MTSVDYARLLLSASEEILLLIRPSDRCIVDANEAAARALHCTREALIGMPISELERALQDAFYWEDVAAGRLVALQNADGLLARGDGEMLPVTKSISVLGEGEQAMLALRARDARASAAAADELEASTSLLRSIFESTAEGLLVLDLDGAIMNFNHRFAEMWLLDASAMRSDRAVLRHMVRKCRRMPGSASSWRALLSIGGEEVQEQLDLVDGRCFRVRARPLLMHEQVRGRVLTCSDITDRINYERDLAAARDAAAASERAKASFLAMMSHEIRTPMAGILGMTEIALGGATDPQQRRFIEMAYASAESLLGIINDILDFSKIEAGKFQIESIPFELPAMLQATVQPLQWQADERGLELSLRGAPDLPRWVVGDPTRIRQILINLVGNALKFTERGGVTVETAVAETRADGIELSIAVRDTGIGISPERRQSIFEAFTQSDAAISRRFGGTGLGLTICARLCELMDGRIRVDSEPGAGSTFSFRLPLALADEAATAELRSVATELPARGLDVLVAEDTEVNQIFLRHCLQAAGHRVELVDNGQAAVDAALGGRFEVILMDVQMPGMDGFEATERLRAAGFAGPIVGLTAHAMDGIREECLSHGMSDYLSKPVRTQVLLGLLARLARLARLAPDEPIAAAPRQVPSDAAADAPEVLQREQAIADLGGDERLWRELLAMLWEQADGDLPQIRGGLAAGDLRQACDAAHRLKSSLAMVGAAAAARACAAVEAHGRAQDPAAAGEALAELERSYAALYALAGRSD